MKTILIIIGILLALGLCAFLLPAIIGIIAGIALFKSGHFIWALICIVIGIGTNIGMLAGEFSGGGSGYHDEECPPSRFGSLADLEYLEKKYPPYGRWFIADSLCQNGRHRFTVYKMHVLGVVDTVEA